MNALLALIVCAIFIGMFYFVGYKFLCSLDEKDKKINKKGE